MSYCEYCGEKREPEDKFCPNCGQSFDSSVPTPKKEEEKPSGESASGPPPVKKKKMSSNTKDALTAILCIGIIVGLVTVYFIVYALFPDWIDLIITIIWIVIIGSCAFKIIYALVEETIDWAKKRKYQKQKQKKLQAQQQEN